MKGFTLSMVESAIELSEGRIAAEDIHEIIMMGKEMLAAPLELIDGVEAVLDKLATHHRLVIVTKGDLLDQENKVEQSGLRRFFDHVEILSNKTPTAYADVFARLGVAPEAVLMVGNSIPSDVAPVLAIGGWAAYIPYAHVAVFERHSGEPVEPRYRKLASLRELPDLVTNIDGTGG